MTSTCVLQSIAQARDYDSQQRYARIITDVKRRKTPLAGTLGDHSILDPADNTPNGQGRLGRAHNPDLDRLEAEAEAEAEGWLQKSRTDYRSSRLNRSGLPDNTHHHNMYLLWHSNYRRRHFDCLGNSHNVN